MRISKETYKICPKYQKQKRDHMPKRWASAAAWGRHINISRTVFDSYLVELGYLETDFEGNGSRNKLVITEKGKVHSASSPICNIILWDFDTFAEVVKTRASKAVVHDVCPKCKAYLDTVPDYNHMDYSHTCARCGRVCEYWYADVIYDR